MTTMPLSEEPTDEVRPYADAAAPTSALRRIVARGAVAVDVVWDAGVTACAHVIAVFATIGDPSSVFAMAMDRQRERTSDTAFDRPTAS